MPQGGDLVRLPEAVEIRESLFQVKEPQHKIAARVGRTFVSPSSGSDRSICLGVMRRPAATLAPEPAPFMQAAR